MHGALVETELDEWVRRFWTIEGITTAVHAGGFTDVAVTSPSSSRRATSADELLAVTARWPSR